MPPCHLLATHPDLPGDALLVFLFALPKGLPFRLLSAGRMVSSWMFTEPTLGEHQRHLMHLDRNCLVPKVLVTEAGTEPHSFVLQYFSFLYA